MIVPLQLCLHYYYDIVLDNYFVYLLAGTLGFYLNGVAYVAQWFDCAEGGHQRGRLCSAVYN